MTRTKEPWEIAFRVRFPSVVPITEHGDAIALGFEAGFKAAASQQPQIIRIAAHKALLEAKTLAREMQCNDGHEFDVAFQQALEMTIAKYT